MALFIQGFNITMVVYSFLQISNLTFLTPLYYCDHSLLGAHQCPLMTSGMAAYLIRSQPAIPCLQIEIHWYYGLLLTLTWILTLLMTLTLALFSEFRSCLTHLLVIIFLLQVLTPRPSSHYVLISSSGLSLPNWSPWLHFWPISSFQWWLFWGPGPGNLTGNVSTFLHE